MKVKKKHVVVEKGAFDSMLRKFLHGPPDRPPKGKLARKARKPDSDKEASPRRADC